MAGLFKGTTIEIILVSEILPDLLNYRFYLSPSSRSSPSVVLECVVVKVYGTLESEAKRAAFRSLQMQHHSAGAVYTYKQVNGKLRIFPEHRTY